MGVIFVSIFYIQTITQHLRPCYTLLVLITENALCATRTIIKADIGFQYNVTRGWFCLHNKTIYDVGWDGKDVLCFRAAMVDTITKWETTIVLFALWLKCCHVLINRFHPHYFRLNIMYNVYYHKSNILFYLNNGKPKIYSHLHLFNSFFRSRLRALGVVWKSNFKLYGPVAIREGT